MDGARSSSGIDECGDYTRVLGACQADDGFLGFEGWGVGWGAGRGIGRGGDDEVFVGV